MNITEQPEYQELMRIIDDLNRETVLERLNGNCLSASDLIQNALDASGVKARILECSLIATIKKNGDQKIAHFVGYNFWGAKTPDSIDTHVVTLVEAEIPFIVDASIGYILNKSKMVVVAPLSNRDPDIIAEQQADNYSLIYRVKKNIRLTNLHQKTLLDRVNSDQKIRKEVTTLGWLVRILIGVGIFNMVANTWLVVLKFMYP